LQFGYGGNPNNTTSDTAAFVDRIWGMGKYQYPGGCDPTYSYDFAIRAAIGMYPELTYGNCLRGGFGRCVYTSNLDVQLRNLDTSNVKNN